MHSAPNENPARVSSITIKSAPLPPLITRNKNIEESPKTANPATPNPITVPPLKATFIA